MTLAQQERKRRLAIQAHEALYEQDLYRWAVEQAALLEARRFDDLDLKNLADEVMDVARREAQKLESLLTRVVQHLLKWDHQAERRGASWARSVREHRRRIGKLLEESPSLTARTQSALDEAFLRGRVAALDETGLPETALPEVNPYTWDDVMTRKIIWPDD